LLYPGHTGRYLYRVSAFPSYGNNRFVQKIPNYPAHHNVPEYVSYNTHNVWDYYCSIKTCDNAPSTGSRYHAYLPEHRLTMHSRHCQSGHLSDPDFVLASEYHP